MKGSGIITKKQINDLKLEHDDIILVMLDNKKILRGKFRLFGDYFVFVECNRRGHTIDPKDLRRVRKVITKKGEI